MLLRIPLLHHAVGHDPCRSQIELKAPYHMRLRVNVEKKFSAALSQDPDAGMNWNVQRGYRLSHCLSLGSFGVSLLSSTPRSGYGPGRRARWH